MKKSKKKSVAPVRLREEPSFQEVMADMRKRRKKENARKRNEHVSKGTDKRSKGR